MKGALLFAGAWEMDLSELRRYWIPIAFFATLGVALGILVAYVLLAFGAGIDGRTALMFGTLVAATDPVAVLALFRELRVDRGLATIVEGESLFNDGIAVVAFRILVLGTAGGAGAIALHPAQAIGAFVVLTAGGSLVGIALGLAAAWLMRCANDAFFDILITVLAAYGSYVLGEWTHGSGIVAVIAAGLACSGVRSTVGASKAAGTVDRFWELAAFLANVVLFLLVGLAIDLKSLTSVGWATAWGVAAVLVARAASVYGLAPLSAAAGRPIPHRWRHVIALGGLRGALSMALVLSLPEDFQYRALLIAMVYSVVLFTLVVQGLCIGPAIGALALGRREQDG